MWVHTPRQRRTRLPMWLRRRTLTHMSALRRFMAQSGYLGAGHMGLTAAIGREAIGATAGEFHLREGIEKGPLTPALFSLDLDR